MSLIGILSNIFIKRFQETNNNLELKEYVCVSPDAIVGNFIEKKDTSKVFQHASGTIIRNKKRVKLEYVEDYLHLTLSDLKIETGFDPEKKEDYKYIRAVGFINQGIGQSISISVDQNISDWIKNAFLYKTRPYNYASVTIGNIYDNEYNTHITTYEDTLLISIRLEEKYLESIIDRMYKNMFCTVSILCDFYKDGNGNKYYIDDLTVRKNQDFNFIFDPSKPALTYNILQIESFLANYFYS